MSYCVQGRQEDSPVNCFRIVFYNSCQKGYTIYHHNQ